MTLFFHPLTIVLAISGCLLAAVCGSAEERSTAAPAAIARVAKMPNLPQPLVIRDWAQVTRDYLDIAFDFNRTGPHLPLAEWKDELHSQVAMPAYIGGPRETESINYLGAIVSGSLVGIDMRSHHGHDWVELAKNFYSEEEGVYVNRRGHATGPSFWYDIFPNVLFYQVNACYPGDDERTAQARSVAEKWHEACVILGGGDSARELPNFNHTGFALSSGKPIDRGWIEPEAAAGLAWLEYMAWVQFQDDRFLAAADGCLRALDQRPADQSPLYEVLLPYGALAAARMNAERGADYNVDKLLNECFEANGRPQARPGWGVITDRWHGDDVHGLVGSTTDGGGYAFAMNTYEWAGAIAPVARYDTRYSRDIGKWMLNLVNASRIFYANAHDAEHQSSQAWSTAHDPKSCIAYEGIRKWKRGAAVATSDYSTVGGRIVQGSFASTHHRREAPPDSQVFEECQGQEPLAHIWEFELPPSAKRWLVVAAERIDRGHLGNAFRFSYSTDPNGPYTSAFTITGSNEQQIAELPESLNGKLYVKVESTAALTAVSGEDQLLVDAMAISYQSNVGPYAQGDQRVTFVALLDEAKSPIVLYRPEDATTDFGLYGSSHVGILGGMVRTTNVEGILQLDLLKTDYFHAAAHPTFLY
ncbi:MAG: hypothetical protein AB7U97_22815, partial [Pirellulales bacterium]